MTCAPDVSIALAMALPIPLLEPVISAVFPLKEKGLGFTVEKLQSIGAGDLRDHFIIKSEKSIGLQGVGALERNGQSTFRGDPTVEG